MGLECPLDGSRHGGDDHRHQPRLPFYPIKATGWRPGETSKIGWARTAPHGDDAEKTRIAKDAYVESIEIVGSYPSDIETLVTLPPVVDIGLKIDRGRLQVGMTELGLEVVQWDTAIQSCHSM